MDTQGSVPQADRKAAQAAHESDCREAAIISDDTMPAIIELLVLDEVEVAKSDKSKHGAQVNEASAQHGCESQPQRMSAQHARQPSRDKVMTAAQFEMYRRALDMHHGETGSDDESQDEYGDDDADEKQKSAASKQRQQQEAYLMNRRLERSKTSHVAPKTDANANMGMDFTSWDHQSKTPSPTLQPLTARSSPGIQTDDDDDDIPLAFLKNQMSRPGQTAERRYSAIRKDHSPQYQHMQPFHFVEHSQTRLRPNSPNVQMRSPTPVILQPMSRAQSPMTRNHGALHRKNSSMGINMSMSNASLLSLSQPSLQPMSYGQSPMPQNYGSLHRKNSSMGLNMSMGNASLLSLSQPSMQRPHTSGGLIAAIDHLQSPSPRNHNLNAPKDFLGIPVNPPKFYGRRT